MAKIARRGTAAAICTDLTNISLTSDSADSGTSASIDSTKSSVCASGRSFVVANNTDSNASSQSNFVVTDLFEQEIHGR